ncbi:unnamed protein product, partial [Chrysoparadoxa australica]
AGAIAGPISGVLYTLAMITTAPLVYLTARAHPREARRLVIRSLPSGRSRKRLVGALRAVEHKPIIGTAMLRLMPIVPSALVCLLAAGIGVRLRDFMFGTILVGPLRPIAISTLG